MIYGHKKYAHQQTVAETETVKRSLLERAGWYVLEEPTKKVEPVDEGLPTDFPGHEALFSAGIVTRKQLLAYDGDLTEIDGIGKATAAKIHAAI